MQSKYVEMFVSSKYLISKILEKMQNRRRCSSVDQSHPGQALTRVAENGPAAIAGLQCYKSLLVDGDASAKPGWHPNS